MNSVTLIGRLARDPELKETNNNKSVANFTLAVDGYKDSTDFINITCWNKVAENVNKYLTKGSLAAVEGSIKTDSYEKDGQVKYKTFVNAQTVKFLDSKQASKNEDNSDDVPF